MEFRILGPLEVLDGGRALELGGAKQRSLLAVLLLNANQAVSTDRLIEALWGDDPPETAAKAVQVYVSRLRQSLGRDRLATKTPGYLLRVGPDELDLQRFGTLREEARESDPAVASAKLREALGLWRGPPLGDFAYDAFAQLEIDRLEELRLACLEERVQMDLGLGAHAELIGELEALVAEHPLREGLRGQLMLALYRSGRQAEALEVYQEGRRLLVEELGLEPGKRLRELEQAILRQDPALDLQPGSVRTEQNDTSRTVFVGREPELKELRLALEAAIGGRGGILLLVGEPGIGKSRLAEELVRQARTRGAQVLVGRCWEAGGAPAYWPWLQSLRTYVEKTEPRELRAQLGTGAADIAQIVPELRERFPDLPEPSLEGEGARFRLFDSAARFLRSAAAARPIVLVLDDLHAADEPSLLLLRFLAGELAETRILVVGTYRDVDPTVRDPLASTLTELARGPVTHRVELSGLTPADVARYVELSTGAAPTPELVAAIHAETEGNPLFVGEVVRLLAAEGRLSDVDVSALWKLGIPQGVREVIGRRLRHLTDACRRILTLAAVVGREFGLDALEKVSELDADELLEVLDEAMTARVLTPVPATRGRLRFAHALIRETLYEGLTTLRRVQLHRRTANALEVLYAADPEPHLAELAYHFLEAAPGGETDKALEYAQRAGDRALKLLAYEEAARLYELALEALELKQFVEPTARCELLLAIGDALAKAGNTPDAKRTLLVAADLARESELSEHLARAALGYGGRFPWLRAGDDERLVPLLVEGLAVLGESESTLRVRLLARLAGALRDEPSLEPRSSLARTAVEIARRLGDPEALSYALVSLATANWGPDTVAEILTVADEVSRLADETHDLDRALQSCWLHYIPALTLGDPARVATVSEKYLRLAEELKQPSQQWYGVILRCHFALFTGEFALAERLAEEGLQLGRRAQSWDAGFSYRVALFGLRRHQGRLAEVEELLRESVERYRGYRLFPCALTVLECELGREGEARRRFEELATDDFAAFPHDGEYLFCLSLLAEVARYQQDRARAAVLHDLLFPYRTLHALASGEASIGAVARYLGLLATVLERWDDADGHFQDALAMNERMGARPWVAHTQSDYARMLAGRDAPGDREKAAELLRCAHATYTELGMHPVAEAPPSLEGVPRS